VAGQNTTASGKGNTTMALDRRGASGAEEGAASDALEDVPIWDLFAAMKGK